MLKSLMLWLRPNPNLPEVQFRIACKFNELAMAMLETVDDDPELAAGLRKLLEAKDCMVRASLTAQRRSDAYEEKTERVEG